MHVAALQVSIPGLGLFFFFSLSIKLTAEASHSSAESKEFRIIHFERGMSAPANQRFGGIIRYQPASASAAAWRSFMGRSVGPSSGVRQGAPLGVAGARC